MVHGHTLTLQDGLTIGGVAHHLAVLRLPAAGDIMDAARESEQVITGPDGRPALAQSPTLMAFTLLGRQIERIGDYEGPFTLGVLGKLSGRDLQSLQIAAELLDQASGADLDRLVREAESRGRADGAS